MADAQEFYEFLKAKGISDITIRKYLLTYKQFRIYLKERVLNQDLFNGFLAKSNTQINRSCLNNYLQFKKINDISVPKKTGAKSHKKRRLISPQEIIWLGDWLEKRRGVKYRLMLDLSFQCALRRAEVVGIILTDFNWQERLDKGVETGRLKVRGKRSKERYVIVSPELMGRLSSFLKNKKLDNDAEIFNMGENRWHKVFKEAVKSLSDYNYTLHDLRRTRATLWLKEGRDIIQIKNRLGHADISTTQLYVNPEEEDELNAWEKELR